MVQPLIPAPPGETTNFANPKDALHTVNIATQILSIVIVTVFVVLRTVIKIRLHKTLNFEDYATAIGWAIFTLFCACMLVSGAFGGGYHAWDVPDTEQIPFLKASYAATLIYVPMVFTVKLALLSVMLRVFAPDRRKVIVIYISLIILLLYYIPAFFIKLFFCRPISAYWYGPSHGTCINQQKVITADSAISITSDLYILILPVPMLWSLQMTRVKKLRVIAILGAGGLATAFSIWRLVIMVEEGQSKDLTYFWFHCVLTANAEAGIGLICACLPMLNFLFARVREFTSNRNTSSNQNYIGSYGRSGGRSRNHHHELDSWPRLSMSKRRTPSDSVSLTFGSHDQAQLISTAEGPAEEESLGSWSLPSERHREREIERERGRNGPVIQKDVTVSQTYEIR